MLGISFIALLIPAFAIGSGGNGAPEHSSLGVVVPPTIDSLEGCGLGACVQLPWRTQARQTSADTLTPTVPPTGAAVAAIADPTAELEAIPTMEVRPGDTLIALAVWFEVTPFDIAVASGRAVDDFLAIGEVLAIPVPAAQFVMPPVPDIYVEESEAAETPFEPEPVVVAIPQPTVAPTPRPFVPPPSRESVAAIICSFPWPCDTFMRIAMCESGMNPSAVNPYGYYGLFQIAGMFPGWDDAYTNALVAYEQKYLPSLARGGDGLAPWPVCRYY